MTIELVDTQSVSMDEQRVKRVIQRFKASCEAGIFPGGQLVVRRFGKMVVNEAFGIARGYRREECISPVSVTPQRLFPVYSIGKAIAATAIAMLEERGILMFNNVLQSSSLSFNTQINVT